VGDQQKNDEWYTPAKYIEAARQAFGGTIDVDPASNPLAQQTVKARQYFTKKIDGLKQEWPGAVWLNPPYTVIRQFTDHLLAELDSGHCQSAILLGPSSTDAEWYHRAAARAEAWYFPDHRIKFYDQDGGVQQALWPSVLFYFGPKPNAFCKAFKPIGGYVGLLTSWRPYGVVS